VSVEVDMTYVAEVPKSITDPDTRFDIACRAARNWVLATMDIGDRGMSITLLSVTGWFGDTVEVEVRVG